LPPPPPPASLNPTPGQAEKHKRLINFEEKGKREVFRVKDEKFSSFHSFSSVVDIGASHFNWM
jgi:hypothetical protein